MTYTVTIASPAGQKICHPCAGANDQEALIYAGQVVRQNAEGLEPTADVAIERDGQKIGPEATVADMINRSV